MIRSAIILLLVTTSLLIGGFEQAIGNKQPFLKPEEAFAVSSIQADDSIVTTIKLGEKIHIYEDSLHIKVTKPQNFEIKNFVKPQPIEKDGDKIYEGEIQIKVPLKEIESKIEGDYTLTVEFEGCSDSGICYQPQVNSFDFQLPGSASSTELTETKPALAPAIKENIGKPIEEKGIFAKIGELVKEGNTAKIAEVLKSESMIFVLFLFFLFGLLLSLTPCIFPMIPILSSIIVSQSSTGERSAMRSFFISLVYVLSMAVTYTVVGLIAGLLGADIQTAMQNPWVLTIFAGLFVALAFSLFGYYEIGLPSSIQSRITKASDSAQGKGVFGTAIMGLLSALIVGPCVAPPLGGAILFISATGDALLGGLALFVMSLGMGMPLLLVGIGAGKFMPKPGGWMTKISQVFGIMMLGMAIFMLERILPESVVLILWGMLFIGTSLYLGLFDMVSPSNIGTYASKIAAIAFLAYGLSLYMGAISGATSMMRPFERFTGDRSVAGCDPVATESTNRRGYSIQRLLSEVEASEKPVIVDFGKKSCTACKELDEITFKDPSVIAEMGRFTFIKVDLTDNTAEDQALLAHFNLFGTPNIIFFDKKNSYLSEMTLTGYVNPQDFLAHIKKITE